MDTDEATSVAGFLASLQRPSAIEHANKLANKEWEALHRDKIELMPGSSMELVSFDPIPLVSYKPNNNRCVYRCKKYLYGQQD